MKKHSLRFVLVIIGLSLLFSSCKTTSNTHNEDRITLGYKLLNHRYGHCQNGCLYYLTNYYKKEQDEHIAGIIEEGISEFIKRENDFSIYKCDEEFLKALDTKKLDEEFRNLRTVELDPTYFSNSGVLNRKLNDLPVYEVGGKANGALDTVSFPVIQEVDGEIFGFFIEEGFGGNLYIYKLTGSQWEVYCAIAIYLI